MESARGSGQEEGGGPGVGTRQPSGRSRGAVPARGKAGARWRGALVPGRAPRRPPESGDSHPRAALGASTARLVAGALRARVPAQSLRGAARPPPRPAERLAGTKPQPMPRALLLFGGAKRNVHPLRAFPFPALRLSRDVLDADIRIDTLYGPPAPEVRRSESLAVRARSAARSYQLLAGPGRSCRRRGGGWWLQPQSATTFLPDWVAFLDLLEKITT